MLSRDDWRSLGCIFAAYQDALMSWVNWRSEEEGDITKPHTEPRRELAVWLRDHDMPLLEIDTVALAAIPLTTPDTTLPTPGGMLADILREHDCAFEFTPDGELVEGVLAWHLRTGLFEDDQWYADNYGHGAVLRLTARRLKQGDYQVTFRRSFEPVPPEDMAVEFADGAAVDGNI